VQSLHSRIPSIIIVSQVSLHAESGGLIHC
jgi:hypothetical protein